MIETMQALVNAAVTTVFDTMLNMRMAEDQTNGYSFEAELQIASSVGFTGNVNGVIYLYTTVPFAGLITQGLLGLTEPSEVREEYVNDAMGEMANMVVGHIKSRLVDSGLKCVMTIPSIVRGCRLGIEAVSRTKMTRSTYRHADNVLLVEVLLQEPASAGR